MKRIILTLFICYLVFSCATTTTERLVMSKLYSISTTEHEDIRGNFTTDSLLILKSDVRHAYAQIVTFDKTTFDSGDVIYSVVARYLGPDWRFLDKVMIKTDTTLYTLKDDDPSRIVLSGSYVSVQEIVAVHLSKDIIKDIKETSTLTFQYYQTPKILPTEGLEILKNFIN